MQSDSEYVGGQESQITPDGSYRLKKQVAYEKSINSGSWNEDENLKYTLFVDVNRALIGSRSKRRNSKVFKEMSKFLVTRNSIQCRSHHQKQIEKYSNVSKVIHAFKEEFGEEEYKRRLEECELADLSLNHSQSQSSKQEISKKQNRSATVEVQTQIAGLEFQLVCVPNTVAQQPPQYFHGAFNPLYQNMFPFNQYPQSGLSKPSSYGPYFPKQ